MVDRTLYKGIAHYVVVFGDETVGCSAPIEVQIGCVKGSSDAGVLDFSPSCGESTGGVGRNVEAF